MIAALISLNPQYPTVYISESQRKLTIGRGTSCDIMIKAAEVSKEHCTLEIQQGGRSRRSAASSNGAGASKTPKSPEASPRTPLQVPQLSFWLQDHSRNGTFVIQCERAAASAPRSRPHATGAPTKGSTARAGASSPSKSAVSSGSSSGAPQTPRTPGIQPATGTPQAGASGGSLEDDSPRPGKPYLVNHGRLQLFDGDQLSIAMPNSGRDIYTRKSASYVLRDMRAAPRTSFLRAASRGALSTRYRVGKPVARGSFGVVYDGR